MRKKYFLLACFLLLVLIITFLWNIIYAFACSSEKIDKQMLNVMLQGRFASTKEINLIINSSSYNIPLPNGSGEINENEYLVPTSSWIGYRYNLNKTEWNYFDQIVTLIRIKNISGDEFDISIKPFTGAYQLLKYSSKNK
jgi:hypothetical protein